MRELGSANLKVLMLGWEYPPKITGGLGKACEGLTHALAERGIEIRFVVPRVFGDEHAPHMALHVCEDATPARSLPAFLRTFRARTPLRPYAGAATQQTSHYAGDLLEEVSRYTEQVRRIAAKLTFDLIHAHDWMTFPSAWELKAATGLPMIVHAHSLEADRNPTLPNEGIQEVERRGFQEADRVIAVSAFTAEAIRRQYGISEAKIRVVHNGLTPTTIPARVTKHEAATKQILFLGRVTDQKGPGHFVRMAKALTSLRDDVRFSVVGEGDALPTMQNQVRALGLAERFEFRGFLSGHAVTEAFANADVYVMPSVSEPFGLTAIEAVAAGTPLVLSRQSGVSEVLPSAATVDFWETHRCAQLVHQFLESPQRAATSVAACRRELRDCDWANAAARVGGLYAELAS